eukprot:TRINITY_DN31837_c0_g1_i1.p1 TRINITY_DN31837_c0_g1~~TRINITY_DN31837_c0_g1_i1.p1  ORF type:complete len:135 (+),score=14.82 TRINITY_DN31837_c0_g1_i1:64-468(+)
MSYFVILNQSNTTACLSYIIHNSIERRVKMISHSDLSRMLLKFKGFVGELNDWCWSEAEAVVSRHGDCLQSKMRLTTAVNALLSIIPITPSGMGGMNETPTSIDFFFFKNWYLQHCSFFFFFCKKLLAPFFKTE